MALGKKKKTLNMEADLIKNGVKPKGSTNGDCPVFTTQDTKNYSKDQYEVGLQNLDIRQVCFRIEHIDPPKGLPGWLIEHMLYFRGSLVGFDFVGKFYLLPYSMTKGINLVGLPNGVRPLTYNGTANDGERAINKNLELKVLTHADSTIKDVGILLYDKIPSFSTSVTPMPTVAITKPIIKNMCEMLARLDINVITNNKKVFLKVKDPNQKAIVQKELESAFNSESAFALITDGLDIQDVKTTSDVTPQDLWETFTSYNSYRCMLSGIPNNGTFEKKERVVTSELQSDSTQSDILIEEALYFRNEFIKQVQAQFPHLEELKKWKVRDRFKKVEENKTDNDSEEDNENDNGTD